jgi:uncharacterized membrane protein YphA (DoxX/SURF4 family)
MERFSRSGILIARVMISMVFLLNALGVIDQNIPAREMMERGAPATLVSHSLWLSAGTLAFMGQLINFSKNLAILGGLLFVASTQSQPALSRSIYAKVRNGAVLTAARQPQP